MKRLVIALVTALLALPAAFVVAPTPPAAAALPPFSAIGDSTLLGMTSSAKAVLNSSYSMLYDARSCRRLIITSCRGRGVVPPNTLQTMRALNGRLGDAVVIMAGYDDWYNFGGAVDQIVAEARRQGVGRVIWLTYRSQGPYVGIGGAYFATYRQFNAILAAKVREHPELILADWDTYTLGKSSWFAADGIHISSAGATALAHFLKAHLDAAGACTGATAAPRGSRPPRPRPCRSPQTAPGRFTATNQRLIDTRADAGDTVDAPVAAGHLVGLPLVAQGKVPAGTTAVMVNLTAVSACGAGFVTAFPCGAQVPLASNLNVGPARTRAAMATVMLNAQGELCVYSSQRTDLVVDLFGSFGPSGQAVNPIPPDRFLDTRNAAGARNPKTGFVGPGTFALPVAGVGPVPAGARAVLLNVTAVDPTAGGFVTVHPAAPRPGSSNVNFRVGQIVANLAVAGLDGSGQVCFTANVATHLVVDVVGWLGDTGPEGAGPDPRAGHGHPHRPRWCRRSAAGWRRRADPGARRLGCSAPSPPSRRRVRAS